MILASVHKLTHLLTACWMHVKQYFVLGALLAMISGTVRITSSAKATWKFMSLLLDFGYQLFQIHVVVLYIDGLMQTRMRDDRRLYFWLIVKAESAMRTTNAQRSKLKAWYQWNNERYYKLNRDISPMKALPSVSNVRVFHRQITTFNSYRIGSRFAVRCHLGFCGKSARSPALTGICKSYLCLLIIWKFYWGLERRAILSRW